MNAFQSSINSWDDIEKSIADVSWNDVGGPSDQAGTISLRARDAMVRSLRPAESYELVIAVNAAVKAITRNIAKAKIRLFSRSGREITGGPAFDLLKMPAPKTSTRKWLEQVVSWRNIAGEWACNIIIPDGQTYPTSILPLDPQRLWINEPLPVNSIADVVRWRYQHLDGATEYIRGDYLIYEGLFNPNRTAVRGLSPLVTGSVVAGTSYHIGRYNEAFFQNSGIPSHLIVLPDGTPRSQRQDFERRYLAEFGNISSNSHKVMVVAGKDVKFQSINESFQDGAFMELTKWNDEKVGQLFGVPSIEMFNLMKTRFDTAPEERKMFAESTLIPQMDDISEILQLQLIDPYFRFSPVTTAARTRLGKSMARRFEKAIEEDQSTSPIIVLLDHDTLPIMSDVKLSQMAYAEKLKTNFNMSAQEAADWLDMDIEERPERLDVWVKNDQLNITHPEMNAQLIPGVKQPGDSNQPAAKEYDEEEKSLAKTIDKFIQRKLRKLALKSIDAGGLFTLQEADSLDDKTIPTDLRKRISRVLRHEVRQIINSNPEHLHDAVKDHFNGINPLGFL